MTAHLPCPTPRCDSPRPGNASVCGSCRAVLERSLAAIPDLVQELTTTLARQGNHGPATTRTTRTPPLPYDPRASTALDILHSTLLGWEHALLAPYTRPHGPRCAACQHHTCGLIAFTTPPPPDTADMARWLHRRLPHLLRHPAAGEAVDEITAATRTARRTIDSPPGSTFAGTCPACQRALYARPGAAVARCPDCRDHLDIAQQHQKMLDSIGDQLLHSTALAAVLLGLGVRVPASTIRYWAAQGRLHPHGHDAHDRPLYRVSQVIDLYVERLERAAERATRKEVRLARAGRQQ